MDVHSKQVRSYNMSRIRSRDTEPERTLRKQLWAVGLRGYRLHPKLPGRPDIVFTRSMLAIFVDGCFWHGCRVCAYHPDTNAEFWEAKISANVERDRRVARELRGAGWRVLRIWEHELRKNPRGAVGKVRRVLRSATKGR